MSDNNKLNKWLYLYIVKYYFIIRKSDFQECLIIWEILVTYSIIPICL